MERLKNIPVPAPLVPTLPAHDDPTGRDRHLITDLQEGDLLHFLADVFGQDPDKPLYKKGSIVPVFGYCRCDDLNGAPYQVRAYLPGFGTTWAAREARRFPTALQEEVLFTLPLMLTELDLTDHAEALALERHCGAKIIPLYPTPAHVLRRMA